MESDIVKLDKILNTRVQRKDYNIYITGEINPSFGSPVNSGLNVTELIVDLWHSLFYIPDTWLKWERSEGPSNCGDGGIVQGTSQLNSVVTRKGTSLNGCVGACLL